MTENVRACLWISASNIHLGRTFTAAWFRANVSVIEARPRFFTGQGGVYIILAAILQRKSLTAVLMIVEYSKFASGSTMNSFHKFPDLFQNVCRYGHPKANPSQVVCISTLFWDMNQ
jgi:hypothetical protein